MNNWFLIYGPMKAGKTTRLQTFARMCKQKYIIINHKKDTRFGIGVIATHDKKKVPCYSCESIKEFETLMQMENPESLFIDETHFHNMDFIDFLIKNYSGKKIYFSGLDKDFNGHFFAATQKLQNIIPESNKIALKALCECGMLAEFSKLCGPKPESGNILIGDNYVPVCVRCFYLF